MTVIDIILGHQLILLSLIFAVVPLLAAMTLSLVARLKRNAAKRARAAARVAARKALIAAQEAELLAQADHMPETVTVHDAPAAAATPIAGEQDSQDQPVAEEGSEQGAPESPELQNILSSVFVDDEASAHLETLASELPEVEASLLVTMSAQISQQMRAQHAPDAQS